MTWRDALDDALDATPTGPVRVGDDAHHAEVDVVRAGPIGVRVARVRVRRADDRDPVAEAERLTRDLRGLPHRVRTVEADPALGAVLRSRDDERRGRDFYEVVVDGARDVEVTRQVVGDDGARTPAPWDATREQLGELLDVLEG